MKLGDWINKHPRDKRVALRKRLARKLNVSEPYVRSMANGNRPVPIELAPGIQDFTGGEVAIADSCPELFAKLAKSLPHAVGQ